MSEQIIVTQPSEPYPVETMENAEPSDAPRPILIGVASLAILALCAELYVGISSQFAPTITPQVATAPAQQSAPATPPTPSLPVQVPPAGG